MIEVHIPEGACFGTIERTDTFAVLIYLPGSSEALFMESSSEHLTERDPLQSDPWGLVPEAPASPAFTASAALLQLCQRVQTGFGRGGGGVCSLGTLPALPCCRPVDGGARGFEGVALLRWQMTWDGIVICERFQGRVVVTPRGGGGGQPGRSCSRMNCRSYNEFNLVQDVNFSMVDDFYAISRGGGVVSAQ